MPLNTGDQLGPYEITAHLGTGGMGEVYRARDATLKRDVAVKILPAAFAADPERVARFQREAEVLASFNHAGIAQIYGFVESGGVRGIAMEFVDGPALKGPLPLETAVEYARQMVEALEYAHERGVIHRDLKPANVKITGEGKLKLLDFGLARAIEDPAPASDPNNSPTLTLGHTRVGQILGTPAYMAPEQVVGKAADRRSDIFSFGAVLYEMLTGERAFQGKTTEETLAAVLKLEPNWGKLPKDPPEAIRKLLARCLDKDRKQRLQAIGEARIVLENPVRDAPAPGEKRNVAAWAAVALVFGLAAGALALVHFRETPRTAAPETRLEINTPSTSDPLSFAISPDGRQIAFVASGDGPPRLWLRRLDTTAAQTLPGTEGASSPFWSPDSRSIGFFADGKLRRLDLGSGASQTLINAVDNRGGTWSADGTILFTPTGASPLFRIPASGGGEPVAVTRLEKQVAHYFPQFLPGGHQFVFYALGTSETAGIYLGSLDSKETKRLAPADVAGVYSPNGWLLFLRGGTLLAQRLDLGNSRLTGDPVTVADKVASVNINRGALSVSSSGLIAYRSSGAGRSQLVWFDRPGKNLGALGTPDASLLWPRLSPDGRRVAVARIVQGNEDIWLLDGARSTRLTFDTALDTYPTWSPDGSRIVFTCIDTDPVPALRIGCHYCSATLRLGIWSTD